MTHGDAWAKITDIVYSTPVLICINVAPIANYGLNIAMWQIPKSEHMLDLL